MIRAGRDEVQLGAGHLIEIGGELIEPDGDCDFNDLRLVETVHSQRPRVDPTPMFQQVLDETEYRRGFQIIRPTG